MLANLPWHCPLNPARAANHIPPHQVLGDLSGKADQAFLFLNVTSGLHLVVLCRFLSPFPFMKMSLDCRSWQWSTHLLKSGLYMVRFYEVFLCGLLMFLSWAEYCIYLRKHQILDLQTPNFFCYLPHRSIVFFQLKMARLSYANISLALLYKMLTFKSYKVQGFESTSGIMCALLVMK